MSQKSSPLQEHQDREKASPLQDGENGVDKLVGDLSQLLLDVVGPRLRVFRDRVLAAAKNKYEADDRVYFLSDGAGERTIPACLDGFIDYVDIFQEALGELNLALLRRAHFVSTIKDLLAQVPDSALGAVDRNLEFFLKKRSKIIPRKSRQELNLYRAAFRFDSSLVSLICQQTRPLVRSVKILQKRWSKEVQSVLEGLSQKLSSSASSAREELSEQKDSPALERQQEQTLLYVRERRANPEYLHDVRGRIGGMVHNHNRVNSNSTTAGVVEAMVPEIRAVFLEAAEKVRALLLRFPELWHEWEDRQREERLQRAVSRVLLNGQLPTPPTGTSGLQQSSVAPSVGAEPSRFFDLSPAEMFRDPASSLPLLFNRMNAHAREVEELVHGLGGVGIHAREVLALGQNKRPFFQRPAEDGSCGPFSGGSTDHWVTGDKLWEFLSQEEFVARPGGPASAAEQTGRTEGGGHHAEMVDHDVQQSWPVRVHFQHKVEANVINLPAGVLQKFRTAMRTAAAIAQLRTGAPSGDHDRRARREDSSSFDMADEDRRSSTEKLWTEFDGIPRVGHLKLAILAEVLWMMPLLWSMPASAMEERLYARAMLGGGNAGGGAPGSGGGQSAAEAPGKETSEDEESLAEDEFSAASCFDDDEQQDPTLMSVCELPFQSSRLLRGLARKIEATMVALEERGFELIGPRRAAHLDKRGRRRAEVKKISPLKFLLFYGAENLYDDFAPAVGPRGGFLPKAPADGEVCAKKLHALFQFAPGGKWIKELDRQIEQTLITTFLQGVFAPRPTSSGPARPAIVFFPTSCPLSNQLLSNAYGSGPDVSPASVRAVFALPAPPTGADENVDGWEIGKPEHDRHLRKLRNSRFYTLGVHPVDGSLFGVLMMQQGGGPTTGGSGEAEETSLWAMGRRC